MKRKDLIRQLEKFGWWFKRHGANHDVYTNGLINEVIERHNEIPEPLTKKILKTVKANPPKEK